MNDLEHLTKLQHSIQFAISDLKTLIQSDNLLLGELTMASIRNFSDEEAKITRLVKILELETSVKESPIR